MEEPAASCKVSSTFPDSILQWCELITKYADLHGIGPDMVAAVMLQESGGQHLAYSHSGAVGLLQVMPRDGIAAGFMCKNGPCFAKRPTIEQLQDPEFNINYGTQMLAGLNNRFGDIREALKSYGPMDVGYSYADKVIAIHNNYGG
jgi:soluble lytic murein transglycosylase-like protein